ncbi:MAG: DUF4292 domain-containing protein [Lentimicrobiaceae bacterium]|nr:DUF4292 domain-containing protein [Lentimicrobiaceae bacterium]
MKYFKLIFCFFILVFAAHFSMAQTTDSISTIDSTFSYASIHYKGAATIEIDEQIFSGQFNLVNIIDSFLYMQLNVGIEAGRILLTPDNILFINKLQKNYYDGDYTFLEQLIDVDIDFYTLQAIFNNFPITLPEELLLSYERNELSFFNTLILEHEYYPIKLKLEIKKVTFNEIPKVSATVPKNFTAIRFWEED